MGKKAQVSRSVEVLGSQTGSEKKSEIPEGRRG